MEVLSDNTEIPYAGHPCADSVIGHSSESSVAHFIACAGKSKTGSHGFLDQRLSRAPSLKCGDSIRSAVVSPIAPSNLKLPPIATK